MDIIKTITDFPVIVQGALGSALFALILYIGQKLFKFASEKFGDAKEVGSSFALIAHNGKDKDSQYGAFFFCLYGAIHYMIKGIIVIVLSMFVENIFYIFSIVGYIFSVYFFFRALLFVPHTKSLGTLEERKEKFDKMLKKHTDSKT